MCYQLLCFKYRFIKIPDTVTNMTTHVCCIIYLCIDLIMFIGLWSHIYIDNRNHFFVNFSFYDVEHLPRYIYCSAKKKKKTYITLMLDLI